MKIFFRLHSRNLGAREGQKEIEMFDKGGQAGERVSLRDRSAQNFSQNLKSAKSVQVTDKAFDSLSRDKYGQKKPQGIEALWADDKKGQKNRAAGYQSEKGVSNDQRERNFDRNLKKSQKSDYPEPRRSNLLQEEPVQNPRIASSEISSNKNALNTNKRATYDSFNDDLSPNYLLKTKSNQIGGDHAGGIGSSGSDFVNNQ